MNLDFLHPATLLRKLREYTRLLWVRVVILGLLSFVALGITQLIERFVPEPWATSLSGEAADRLLDIIANAMLAVTIFSITVMVSVYRSTSNQWTPRVHRLIIQDKTTQNTMAVFIGAYVYALVAIILREVGVYVDDRAFVLFIMTVIVMAVIVFYLIRWVLHLQSFGSLIDITRQVEKVTLALFKERLKNPCLGAYPLIDDVPEEAETIRSETSGYIQHIYPEALNEIAREHGVTLYLIRDIGDFVFLNEPLAKILKTGEPKSDAHNWDALERRIRANIIRGDVRTFDQDPRFGLTVMGEIGSKAMSPGVNDPGTAIDVITRIGRILSAYKDEVANTPETPLENLYVAPLSAEDLLNDGFAAMARDSGNTVEVQQALQRTLSGLMRHPDDELTKMARVLAEVALARAVACTDFEPDRARLLDSARSDVRACVEGKS